MPGPEALYSFLTVGLSAGGSRMASADMSLPASLPVVTQVTTAFFAPVPRAERQGCGSHRALGSLENRERVI